MSANEIAHTHFYHVHVKVTLGVDLGTYHVECHPESLTVTYEDSVILYQLVEAPEGVEFWSIDVRPTPQTQFGPPEIGAGGRMLTLDDIDREKVAGKFHVTLHMTDASGLPIPFDPQVINRPG